MNFNKAGSGPPVILVHGLGASKFSWEQTARELSSRFTTFAVDLLGFDHSPAPADFGFTVAGQADAVKEFVRNEHLPEPIIIVGHSMGGSICLELAAKAGQSGFPSLNKVVLIDPLAPPPPPAFLPIDLSGLQAPPKVLAEKILRRIYKPGSIVNQGVIDGYADGLSSSDQIIALRSSALSLVDLSFSTTTLGKIKTETLIIWGEDDPILPPNKPIGRAEELRKALFKASLEMVKNCGHVPQEEAPMETNKLIAEFLK
jgi:pimeloyl-ACP methyl ester carboxylesterase